VGEPAELRLRLPDETTIPSLRFGASIGRSTSRARMAPRKSMQVVAVVVSLMPGDSAFSATSTNCRRPYAASCVTVRCLPRVKAAFASVIRSSCELGSQYANQRTAVDAEFTYPALDADCDATSTRHLEQSFTIHPLDIAGLGAGDGAPGYDRDG